MQPRLEAYKKQHLRHWEESMHLVFTQQLLHYASILLFD